MNVQGDGSKGLGQKHLDNILMQVPGSSYRIISELWEREWERDLFCNKK